MKKIDYKKLLKRLIDEYPHELDKIEKIVDDADKNGQVARIEFDAIIKSYIWSSDEKARLLRLFGYNKREHEIRYTDRGNCEFKTRDYLYTIEHDILSGFEALMKVYKDIESHYTSTYISKDDSYRDIFAVVIKKCKDENKVTYLKAILDNLTTEDIKRLIAPYYSGNIRTICNGSIFTNIIASKDLNLIKEYIDYVDDINMYLQEAVATGDIEIVKFFLDKGADINYLTDEVVLGRLTPLKTAIANNDYEMAKFLIDNGADVNLQVDGTNFINRLNNQIEVIDRINLFNPYYHRESFNEEDEKAKQHKYIRVSSPLEYAIKLREQGYKGDPYYTSYKVYFKGETHNVKNDLLVDKNTVSEQVKNRGALVDLIFDKLEDKKSINYNDLINFTFITRDVEKFKKYKEYAIEYNYQFDFDSLFEMYFDFAYGNGKEIVIPFMDLIAKYDKDSNLYLKLFNYYLNKGIIKYGIYNKFSIDDFNKELLNRISEEKRKKIFLIPYCKDIDSLKYLISFGFDINQTDEKGRNILYYLLCDRYV